MKTGQITNTGVKVMNSNKRPKFYLEKHYPVKDREDFFKWVIITPNGIAKDYKGDEMYFDNFNLDHAKQVLKAIKKTNRLNKKWVGNI